MRWAISPPTLADKMEFLERRGAYWPPRSRGLKRSCRRSFLPAIAFTS